MSRRIAMKRQLTCVATLVLFAGVLRADDLLPKEWARAHRAASAPATLADAALWAEFGLAASDSADYAGTGIKTKVTAYRLKDTTGALAAWEYLRPADGKSCSLAPFCSEDAGQQVVFDANYVLSFTGQRPTKKQVDELFQQLPGKRESSLPAILTFVPRRDLVPNSARYILGPASLKQFAPELASAEPGFEQGTEGHLTSYKVNGAPVRLVLFYCPTPEMARLRSMQFKLIPNTVVKRSAVLIAVVLDAADKQADDLLTRVQYEAKITWNDPPPANQVKILYSLFMNIIIVSCILVALCTLAGLFYAGMRIYRRRFGTLESEEAMTTLHLN
jgi:hypothetical protein